MALATLSVDLVAKLASLEQGFAQSARLADRAASQIERRFSQLGGNLKTQIASAIAGIVSIAFVRNINDGVDALNDLREATGSTIPNLSALEDIANRNGQSIDVVGDALVKMNKALSDAKPDSDVGRALKALGLDAAELRKLDPSDALHRIARALNGFADDGNKARIVQELFGKSLREVAPLLRDLGEQTELVGKVSAEQAAKAKAFNDQLGELAKNSKDAARSMVANLVPAATEVLKAFNERGFIAALDKLGNIAFDWENNQARKQLKLLEADITSLEATIDTAVLTPLSPDEISVGVSDQSLRAAEEQLKRLAELKQKRDEVLRGIVERSRAGAGRGVVNPQLVVPEPPLPKLPDITGGAKQKAAEITEAQRALASYVATLAREREAVEGLTEEQQALNFLRTLGPTGEIQQVRELVLRLASESDQRKDVIAQIKLQRDAMLELDTARQKVDRELDELSGRVADERKRLLTTRLEARIAAGEVFTPEEMERIVKGIGGVNDELKETKGIAEELGLTFASAFENAIVEGGKLSDVLKGLETDILRITTRKLVTEPGADFITNLLKGATGQQGAGGSGGDIGAGLAGFVRNLFGTGAQTSALPSTGDFSRMDRGGFSASGGGGDFFGELLKRLFSGFFAEGGFIPPGRWGVVGERQPEMAYGGRTGLSVVPMGGGGQVTQNFYLQQPTDRRSPAQIGATAALGLRRAQRNL